MFRFWSQVKLQKGNNNNDYNLKINIIILFNNSKLFQNKMTSQFSVLLNTNENCITTHVNKANDNNKSTCIIVIKTYMYSMLISNTAIY